MRQELSTIDEEKSSSTISTDACHTNEKQYRFKERTRGLQVDEELHPTLPSIYRPHSPSLRLLLAFIPRRTILTALLPACLISTISGGLSPFLTLVIGQGFQAFATFATSSTPNPDWLIKEIGVVCIELLAVAVATFLLSTLMSAFWIKVGEENINVVRDYAFRTIIQKNMEWFDIKTNAGDENENGAAAAGLMAKFSKETDDIFAATSLPLGLILQNTTILLACLVLAFKGSWSLALLTFSPILFIIVFQSFAAARGSGYAMAERDLVVECADHADRTFKGIETVKAFNAQGKESREMESKLSKLQAVAIRLAGVWAIGTGASQACAMGMFVVGFWWGAWLVRHGTNTPGEVMSVFWAVLIASNSLQVLFPYIAVLQKGKWAMASLLDLLNEPLPPRPVLSGPRLVGSHLQTIAQNLAHSQASLQRSAPSEPCQGNFHLSHVTFAYPARPLQPVLRDVSLFIPAHETTFIVGSSGSGKSSIAALLAGLYEPTQGFVQVDEMDMTMLDDDWIRENIYLMGQNAATFRGTIANNIMMGRVDVKPSREEVEKACEVSILSDFIKELKEGYDTTLGAGGLTLSGGQRQRLGVARAAIRNPAVLILDEATSALDMATLSLLLSAIRILREEKTTIVITHELGLDMITKNDFIYVLHEGKVVEQGYRDELEYTGEIWREMIHPTTEGGTRLNDLVTDRHLSLVERDLAQLEEAPNPSTLWARSSCSLGVNMWIGSDRMSWAPMFDFAMSSRANIAAVKARRQPVSSRYHEYNPRLSTVGEQDFPTTARTTFASVIGGGESYPSGIPAALQQATPVSHPYNAAVNQPIVSSDSVSPRLPPLSHRPHLARPERIATHQSVKATQGSNMNWQSDVSLDTTLLEHSAAVIACNRQRKASSDTRGCTSQSTTGHKQRSRIIHHSNISLKSTGSGVTAFSSEKGKLDLESQVPIHVPLFAILWRLFRAIPSHGLLLLGLFCCLLAGAVTPVFSFLLSRLLFEVSLGGGQTPAVNLFGGVALSIALADGLFNSLKCFIMETCSICWTQNIRRMAYTRILAQDKQWFDEPEHSSERLVQTMFKDGEEAKVLISRILGQVVVVATMLLLGLVWAMVLGWQLTLAGLAFTPIFASIMAIQARMSDRFQERAKESKEEISETYYETVSNMREIRGMGISAHFEERFEMGRLYALRIGTKGAFFEGCGVGIAQGLIHVSESLLFWVAAVLVAKGTYSYLRMVEVLQLVIFSVSIACQLMAFMGGITKALHAARSLDKLLNLGLQTEESVGNHKPHVSGAITFGNVHFNYPERSENPVLRGLNLTIHGGECIAIVGTSGAGKSTVAALLQRLYRTSLGRIAVDGVDLVDIDVTWLRDHISVVNQAPQLFDGTVLENIMYGSTTHTPEECYVAARACNAAEFIERLPNGYRTQIGKDANLLSGGQIQRLALARALVRGAKVLVLDECTAALDPQNQTYVMDAIRKVKPGRTIIMITHKLPVMKMCDRIVVLKEGAVAEDGTYDSLIEARGAFFHLIQGGKNADGSQSSEI